MLSPAERLTRPTAVPEALQQEAQAAEALQVVKAVARQAAKVAAARQEAQAAAARRVAKAAAARRVAKAAAVRRVAKVVAARRVVKVAAVVRADQAVEPAQEPVPARR